LKAIGAQKSMLENFNASIQHEIKAMLQSDPDNPLLASGYEQRANNFQKMGNLEGRRVELLERKLVETERCRDVIMANLRTIYEASRDVLLLARRELSFAIDEEKYRKIMQERLEFEERTADSFLTEIRELVQEKIGG